MNKVYIIGAGPGGIEYIPVGSLMVIKNANVILYDGLVNDEVLLFANYKSIKICTAKLSQDEINLLFLKYVKKYPVVVRLKQGCPSIFAHTGEDINFLKKNKIEFDIIPGITSALSAPLIYSLPATHRDLSSSVAIITGRRKRKTLPIPVVKADTIIYLMGVGNLSKIVRKLLKNNLNPDTPIMIIENAYSVTQRFIYGNLKNIVEKAKSYKVSSPSVIITGKILKQYKPPKPGNILFTGLDYSRFLKKEEITHIPLIEIKPLKTYKKVYPYIFHIDNYDFIIFTSKNAVKYFYILLNSTGVDIRQLSRTKFCSIGKTTEKAIEKYLNIKSDIVSEKEIKEDLIEELKKIKISGKRIFYPCSNLSDKSVKTELARQGAIVDMVPLYKTVLRKIDFPVDFSNISEIFFTSPSTVKSFIKNFRVFPEGVKLISIGKTTEKIIKQYKIV